MNIQFVHIALYSRALPKMKGNTKKWTVENILAEATRVPENSRHVTNPQQPKFCGMDPNKISNEISRRAALSTDARGHAIRKDAKVLLAFVASWPERIISDRPTVNAWVDENMKFCRKIWGVDNVLTIIEHEDETFPHIHIFVLPQSGPNGCFNARKIHPGEIAKAAAPLGCETKAYKAAMSTFQDYYHEQVGRQFKLERIGPGRTRSTRAQAKINSLDLAIAEKEAQLKSRSQQLDQLQNLILDEVGILQSEDFLASKILKDETGSSSTFDEYNQRLEIIRTKKLKIFDNDLE